MHMCKKKLGIVLRSLLYIFVFQLASCKTTEVGISIRDQKIIEVLAFNEWLNFQKYSFQPKMLVCVELSHDIENEQIIYMKKLHMNAFAKKDCPRDDGLGSATLLSFGKIQMDQVGVGHLIIKEYCGTACAYSAEMVISKYNSNWFVQSVILGPMS